MNPDSHPTNIVVGFSPTPHSEAALRRAIDEAGRREARLVVVNGSPGDRYADPKFASTEDLAAVTDLLQASGVDHEVRQPVRGRDGAAEVLAACEEVDATLVVIGLRRRSTVGKLFLGSTAQTILLNAPCDVLAVKA